MPKILWLTILLSSLSFRLQAQSFSPFLRLNTSIGFERISDSEFERETLTYSPGEGLGSEFGFFYSLKNNFEPYVSIGVHYQINFIYKKSLNSSESSSRYSTFNRKFINAGFLKFFPLSKKKIDGINLGLGITQNLHGKLKRIDNKKDIGSIRYKTDSGYFFDLGIRWSNKKKKFESGVRIRYLELNAEHYSLGPVSETPEPLQKLNGNGIELMFKIIFP